ncbi:MAG: hypothetical protein JSV36_13845, partial [Anaerolineae bacterium]
MSNITFELATPADDPALRRMLRENPLPGAISVSFEREPSYFHGAKVQGPFHQTCIARERSSGEIVGMGSRSIRDVYLNGAPQAVGYLSQLRVKPEYRARRRMLTQAFEFLHHLHQDGRTPFYFSSIIQDNLPARRLLSAGLPGLPSFVEYARMHTLAVHCPKSRRRLPLPSGLRLARGSPLYLDEIAVCLQRNGARHQLAPCWTRETLFHPDHTPDLAPEDFFLALEQDRVVGCLAAWDQNRFKQTVVRGYSGPLGRWRGLVNVGARLAGWPVLPPPNTPFRHAYASHLAVDDDDPHVFAALLRALHSHLAAQGYSYYMIGLSEANPLGPTV